MLGFVFQCEVFHMELWNFNCDQYLSSSFSFTNEEERITFLKDMYQNAKEEQVYVFAATMRSSGILKNDLHIFVNDTAIIDFILKTSGIQKKEYISLFSGSTNVIFHNYSDLYQEENRYITSISYIGKKQAINNLYQKLNNTYQFTAPALIAETEADMMYIVWGIISIFIVLMTCIEIICKKKEMVVRISLGQSVWSIIGKSIAAEILTDFFLFFIVRTTVFHFISGMFMKKETMILFGSGVLLSCLCYFSYTRYDIKMVFANLNDSKTILNVAYIIKAIITAVSIMVLVTNIEFMMRDVRIMGEPNVIAQFRNYSFLLLRDFHSDLEDQYAEQIFLRYYQKANPAICQMSLEDDDAHITYVDVNETAEGVLKDFTTDLEYSSDADAVYFIPQKNDNSETRHDADDCLREMIPDIDDLNIQVVTYNSNKTLTYIDNNTTLGVTTIQNPVVVLSRYNGNAHIQNMCLRVNINNVMFHLSDKDIEEIKHDFDLEKNGIELSKTGVAESFDYHNNILRKTLAFCSSICIFTLLLQLLLIIAINRMEYRSNAMELALKKVLGYGIWQKNYKLLWSGILFNTLIIITLIILGQITSLYTAKICIEVGAVVTGMETGISIVHILWIEAKNIQKILKGGCL